MTVLAGFSWLGLRSFFQHQVISCLLGARRRAWPWAWPDAASPASGSASSWRPWRRSAPTSSTSTPWSCPRRMVVATTAAILLVTPTAGGTGPRPASAAGVRPGRSGWPSLVRSEAILLGPAHRACPSCGGGGPPTAAPTPAPTRGARPCRRGCRSSRPAGLAAAVVIAPVGRPTTWPASRSRPRCRRSSTRRSAPPTATSVYYGDRVGYWSLACIQATEHLVPEGDASAQGKGFRRDRLPVRPRPRRPGALRGGRPRRPHVRPLPAPGADLPRHRRSSPRSRSLGADRPGRLVRHRRRRGRRAGRACGGPAGRCSRCVAIVGQRRRDRGGDLRQHPVPAAGRAGADVPGRGVARRRPRRRARRWAAWTPPGGRRAAAALANPPADGRGTDGAGAATRGRTTGRPTAPRPTTRPRRPGRRHRVDPRRAGLVDGPVRRVRRRAGAGRARRAGHPRGPARSGFTARDATGPLPGPPRRRASPSSSCCRGSCCTGRSWPGAWTAGPGPTPATTCATGSCASSPPTGSPSPSWWSCSTSAAATRSRACGTSSTSTGCCRATRRTPALGGLQQAWTLTNEVAFYLVLPLWAAGAAWLARRLAPRTGARRRARRAGRGRGRRARLPLLGAHGRRQRRHAGHDRPPHPLAARQLPPVRARAWRWRCCWSGRGAGPSPLRLLEWPRRHPLVCWAGAAACFWAVSTQLGLGLRGGGERSEHVDGEGAALRRGRFAASSCRSPSQVRRFPGRCAGWAAVRWWCWGCCRTASTSGTRGYSTSTATSSTCPVFTGSMPAALAGHAGRQRASRPPCPTSWSSARRSRSRTAAGACSTRGGPWACPTPRWCDDRRRAARRGTRPRRPRRPAGCDRDRSRRAPPTPPPWPSPRPRPTCPTTTGRTATAPATTAPSLRAPTTPPRRAAVCAGGSPVTAGSCPR